MKYSPNLPVSEMFASRVLPIVQCLVTYGRQDYQEYITNFDSNFIQYRLDRISSANSDDLFKYSVNSRILAVASLEKLEWDTNTFGFNVAKISELSGHNEESKTVVIKQLISRARSQEVKLLTCRVAYSDISSIHALESSGFRIVDTMNIFLWDACTNTRQHHNKDVPILQDVTVDLLTQNDKNTKEALQQIAITAFQHSRLYNDVHFSNEQKRTFYKSLLDSFWTKPQTLFIVAQNNREPIGFVAGTKDLELSQYLNNPFGYLWLIAVDKSHTGQGIGQALLKRFLHIFSRQVRYIEVGTQINNYPALNLYASAGLKCVSSVVTLHRWLS